MQLSTTCSNRFQKESVRSLGDWEVASGFSIYEQNGYYDIGVFKISDTDKDKKEEKKDELVYCPNLHILTANAIKGSREEYLKIGFNDVCYKPTKQKELNDTLKKWCNL